MDDHYLGDGAAKNEVIKLSMKHNLMSKFTSFVAIEEKVVNPNGKSNLANIKIDLPEGWVYESVFGKKYVNKSKDRNINLLMADSAMKSKSLNINRKLPKTATNMPLVFMVGLLSIMLSFILHFIQKKYAVSK